MAGPPQEKKGQQLFPSLAKLQEEQKFTTNGSEEKPAKFITNINGYMWTFIWITTPGSLGHKLSSFPLIFTIHTGPVTPKAAGEQESWGHSQAYETYPRLRHEKVRGLKQRTKVTFSPPGLPPSHCHSLSPKS